MAAKGLRKLAAILAADVAGYSRLMADDEAATVAALNAARSIFRDHIAAHGGRVVDTAGDSVLAELPSAVQAVECALAIQAALAEINAPLAPDRRMLFRIGVNLGDILVQDDGSIYGDGVNIAARIEALAEPGGVALSAMAHDAVDGKLAATFAYHGEHAVKNIAKPVRVWRTGEAPPALVLPDKPSIAVLPFDNLSGDPEQEYFADGIAEDLITALSRFRWLFVIARNSSFSYKGTSPDVRRVGTELGVRYVLEGSVRKGGERVRISAQLIDATTGAHVWAERYDRTLEDIFAVQDEITDTIAAAIEPELGEVERQRSRRKPPDSLDAWDCYQQGLGHMYRFNREDNAEAQTLFARAAAYDPDFAAAFAGSGVSHLLDVSLGFGPSREDSLGKALAAARRGVTLDDKDAFAHMVLGRVHTIRGEDESAVHELRAAIGLNPNLAMAHYGLGQAMLVVGRYDEAMALFDTAARLSPHDPFLWLFDVLRALGALLGRDFEGALRWSASAGRRASDHFWPPAETASALAHLGHLEEARAALDEARAREPGLTLAFARHALPYGTQDNFEPFFEGLQKAGLE